MFKISTEGLFIETSAKGAFEVEKAPSWAEAGAFILVFESGDRWNVFPYSSGIYEVWVNDEGMPEEDVPEEPCSHCGGMCCHTGTQSECPADLIPGWTPIRDCRLG